MSEDAKYPRLFLVEDDHALLAMLEIALSEEGFELVTAKSGTAALKELEGSGGTQIKALITDIRLGKGPDGWDVGRRARELISGLPVIYMSGDSSHEWSANGVPESVMLQKPFVIAQLITAVTNLLNSASSATALSDTMVLDSKKDSSSKKS